MQKTSLHEANEAAAETEKLRKRAARQAAANLDAPPPPVMVRARVLKLGADKISMGQHVPGVGDAYYEKGEEFDCEQPIAETLENLGWIEILDAAEGEAPKLPLKPKAEP